EANAFLVPTTAEENARQLQEAKNQAERALALYPKDAMAYFALSALASGPTAYESAVLKGLAADPHPTFFVGGLYGREGDLLRTMGRLNEALTNWRRAVALDPLSSWERARMSATLAQLGDMSEARNVIEQALALWPNDREFRITNLMILVFGDSPKEARAFLDDSSKLPPLLSVDAIGAYRAFVAAREAPTGELKAKAFSVIRSTLDAGMLDSTVAAVMYAQLGDIDAAFAATRKSPPPNRQLLSWL